MNSIFLLAGLFAPPLYLIVLGHRFRDTTDRQKSIFWGTTIGWLIAVVVVCLVLVLDPVLWPESGMRTAIVFRGLAIGAGFGFLVGAVRPLGGGDDDEVESPTDD